MTGGERESQRSSFSGAVRLVLPRHDLGTELARGLAQAGAAAMKRAQDAGGLNGLGLNVDDCRKTHEELVAKGVEFVQPPTDRPYGVEAVCRDNSGNWMVLVEQRAYSPEDFEGVDMG